MKLGSALVVAMLAVTGCADSGDDSGDAGNDGGDGGTAEVQPTCEDTFAACGGDAVGSWTFEDFCFDFQIEENPECPAMTFDGALEGSGTLDVDGSGSYALATLMTVTMTVGMPKSCIGGVSCEQMAAATGMACTDLGDTCSCVQVEDTTSTETGSWTTEGSTLTMLADGSSEPTVGDYCATKKYLQIFFAQDQGDMRMVLSK